MGSFPRAGTQGVKVFCQASILLAKNFRAIVNKEFEIHQFNSKKKKLNKHSLTQL